MSNTAIEFFTRNPNLDLATNPHPPEPGGAYVGPRGATWWTGAVPRRGECASVDEQGVLRSLRTPHLGTCTREELLAYFENGWALTEVLFSALQGERAFYAAPYHRLRHPMIFYYGHPAALYVNKLRVAGLLEAIDPVLESHFHTGVDEMSWDDLSRAELEWPAIEAVTEYRRRVYKTVRALIEAHPALSHDHPPIGPEHPLWALFMGFEHERIHLETSSVLIRELPMEWVRRPPEWTPLHPSAIASNGGVSPRAGVDFPTNELTAVEAGRVTIGKPSSWPSYGWDNEYGERTVDVEPFRVQRFLVSNGEFYEFVRSEGYLDQSLWTAEGWGWRQFRNAKWPTFWVSAGPHGLHDYRLRTLFEVVDVPWSWPVEVNFHEAQAYRAWREREDGAPYRLLSEAKHHRLRDARSETADGFPHQQAAINEGLQHGSPGPVNAFERTSVGVHDVFGNVWQWCEDQFHPLPGFRVHPYYDDFSTPCFDAKHQMILGGSFASTGAEASVFARFHFRPHFFQHAGFRLVAAQGPSDAVHLDSERGAPDVYEREEALREYLLLHYGRPDEAMPFAQRRRAPVEFTQRVAARLVELMRSLGLDTKRALDVGCAVGGTSFELARDFEQVLGVDRSESFVRAAEMMRRKGSLRFFLREEGEIGEESEAVVDAAIDRARVTFRRADACSLPAELVGFDAVVASNLLCRLPSPRAFLERLGGPRGVVRPGGVVLLTTPGTWSEAFTPKEAWLGGVYRDGRPLRTLEGIRGVLGDEFELLVEEDIPLIIREHRRKYQYIVSQLTAWRRVRPAR